MKRRMKKLIAAVLTVAMAMGATVPAYADSETSQIDLNSLPGIVQFDMTVQEKQQINDDLMYLKQFDIFEYGELISVNLDSSEQNTKNMVYTIDYDDFLEKIIVDKHSKESTKLIISQNEIVNIVEIYEDGQLFLNNHAIKVENVVENENNMDFTASGVTPYVSDTYFVEDCPYGSSSGYSLYNGMEEQNNVFLYEKWESLTFIAFMTIIKLAVPELALFTTIVKSLYKGMQYLEPESEGLSYKKYVYRHTDSTSVTGYLPQLGYAVQKYRTYWYPKINYGGSVTTTELYKIHIIY